MATRQASKSKASIAATAAQLVGAQKLRRTLRRELRQPSGFQLAVADGIDMLDGAHWDRVVNASTFFLSRSYLRMLEQFGPENIAPRYALVFADGAPVAAAYLQIASVGGERLGKKSAAVEAKNPLHLIAKVLSPAAQTISAGLRERVLVCGNLLSYGFHGVAFAPGSDKRALWPAVAEAIYRIRRAEKLSGQTDFILIKDVTPPEADDIAILSHLSYHPLETEPNMVLEMPAQWQNYDGYLASLASKYRSAIKQQVFKPIEAAGYTVEHLHDLVGHAERLHDLYLQVHEKAGLRLFTLPASYFGALAHSAGDNLLCSVIRRKGDDSDDSDILGFIITLKDGDIGYGYHIGYDRTVAADVPLYLRLLHAAIADGLALGCRCLSLGRTALEPKAGLGARPEAISVWMRHRQPVMNLFVRNLLRVIPHEEAPERSPFKKAGAGK
ncbi:MAG: GNAT family N-acetyltransferase [Proteobacteria bacterium]|nr:GNAT family N-acetyltransferase [Pseudomonadota bacterium]